MKTILCLLALLVPIQARALDPQSTAGMAQQYSSTMTCSSLFVSSATLPGQATVIISTSPAYRSVSIQNRSSTANVYCGDSVNVSSQTANGAFNANTGWELAPGSPGGSASFYLVPGEPFYCVNDTVTSTSTITACRGR